MLRGSFVLEETKCNICSSARSKTLYKSGKPFQKEDKYLITEVIPKIPQEILRCLDCGLIYAKPERGPEELASFYINMADEEYKNEEVGRRISAKNVLSKLRKFGKSSRLLDIGCATGFLLDEARKDGWEVHGVELSKWCVEYAKEKLGLDIFCGTLKNAPFGDSFFDAVILNDVIEHLPDPKNTLIEIRRVLKKDGIVCINTPDIDSLLSKMLKARWWGINQAHLFYFTKETLTKMLTSAGFVPIKFTRHPRTFSFNYWVARFKNYSTLMYNVLKFLAEHTPLKTLHLTINTADQIEVYAKIEPHTYG